MSDEMTIKAHHGRVWTFPASPEEGGSAGSIAYLLQGYVEVSVTDDRGQITTYRRAEA